MTKKKVLAISAVLGIFALVLSAGTMAYFTDRTDAIKNTFTVGNVDIELNEYITNDAGEKVIDNTAWANQEDHVFMPGVSYEKNPVIEVQPKSADAKVYAELKFNNVGAFVAAVQGYTGTTSLGSALNSLGVIMGDFVDVDLDVWKPVAVDISGVNMSDMTGEISFIVEYIGNNGIAKANDKLELFTTITMNKDVKNTVVNGQGETITLDYSEMFDGSFIEITGYAIQADGLEDENTAYNTLFNGRNLLEINE